tara:strand:+ start:599 stop:1003 length:405 start_codon:yes stop_codon:yes gene_type:complete
MATVTAAITLSSAAGDLLTDALSLSDSVSITASETTGLARAKLTSTAKGTASGQATLYTSDTFSDKNVYLYVKNTDTTATDYVYVYDDAVTGDPDWMALKGGEWAFVPIGYQTTLKAYAQTSGTVVEFMVFGLE